MPRRSQQQLALSLLLAVASVTWSPQPAAAARRVRPRFEPTDLELEEAGVIEADLQLGVARSPDAWRLVMPDFELDLGVTEYLELDVDGAYAIEGPSGGPFQLDHAAPDSLWIAAKLGLYDARSDSGAQALALGVQLGPKLPTAAGSHGIGVEGLALLGLRWAPLQLVWNAGAFLEPAVQQDSSARPTGLELGLDASVDLDARAQWQVIASAGFVHFVGAGTDQLTATLGLNWQLIDALALSLVGLTGFLHGGDRFALLLGIAPKLAL